MINRRKGFLILAFIFGGFLLAMAFLLSGDTAYKEQSNFGTIDAPFLIEDHLGDTISSCSWNDKIVLYNFLSVECPTNFDKCPFRLEWFKIKIYNELVGNQGFKDVVVVTSFIDTVQDLNQKIQEFRKYHKIDSDKWIMTPTKYIPFFDNDFLRGNPWRKKDTLFNFKREAHLMTLLVDKDQKIRGKYFTYNFGEVRRITKEISLLIKEEKNNIKDTSELPILGNRDFDPNIDGDTIYHKIPYWSFLNQNGEITTSDDYLGKICLVDFFFTHCPSICPTMTLNMKRIQNAIKKECFEDVELLSYTVDPHRDSVTRLFEYAKSYDVDFNNWKMMTGDQTTIYELGVNGYLVPNQEDALAPGGFLHSEKMILVDQQQRIRGYYDGTDPESIAKIVNDINRLK